MYMKLLAIIGVGANERE